MTIAEFVKTLAARRVELSIADGQISYHGPSEALNKAGRNPRQEVDPIDYLGRAPTLPEKSLHRPLSIGQEALCSHELDRRARPGTLFAARMTRDLKASKR